MSPMMRDGRAALACKHVTDPLPQTLLLACSRTSDPGSLYSQGSLCKLLHPQSPRGEVRRATVDESIVGDREGFLIRKWSSAPRWRGSVATGDDRHSFCNVDCHRAPTVYPSQETSTLTLTVNESSVNRCCGRRQT